MTRTMRVSTLTLVLSLLLLACGADSAPSLEAKGKGDPIVNVTADDAEMNAAKAEARRTLPEFLGILAKPPAGVTEVGFKYPLGGWEHIWVDNVARDGDHLTGILANAPVQEGHALGEKVRVPLAEVSDWAYRAPDGIMRGHRTTKVLLNRMSAEEAAPIKSGLGWD